MERDFSVTFRTKAAPCMASERSRYSINGALVVAGKESAWSICTDGRRIAAVKADEHSGTPGSALVPRDVIGKAAYGCRVHVNGSIQAEDLNAKGESKSDTRTGEDLEGSFPPYADVMPRADLSRGGRRYVAVTVSPALLAECLAAINPKNEANRGVTLLVPVPEGKESVVHYSNTIVPPVAMFSARGVAALMPMVGPKDPAEAYKALMTELTQAEADARAAGK
jgi:hypothetical protein